MNAKLVAIALALFATSAVAGQSTGRDSVYAAPGATFPSAQSAKAAPGNGRGTVTAYDLPAPTPRDKANFAETTRPGRT